MKQTDCSKAIFEPSTPARPFAERALGTQYTKDKHSRASVKFNELSRQLSEILGPGFSWGGESDLRQMVLREMQAV